MDLITLDWETFYGKGYSLSSMNTEAYIRDPRFEPLILGIKVNDRPARAYPRDGTDWKLVFQALDIENNAVLCHHAHFDGAILNWLYGIKPKIWFDTLSMARAAIGSVSANGLGLGAISEHLGTGTKGKEVLTAFDKRLADFTPTELRAYCGYCAENEDSDVNLTYRNFQQMIGQFSKSELQLIDVTVRLFTEPLLQFDRNLLEQYKNSVVANKARLIMQAGVTREELTSNDKFAEVLRRLDVVPPMKLSPTRKDEQGSPIWTYAFAKTDDGIKMLLDHEDERVVAVTEARVGVKTSIAETRAQRYIDMADRGPVPIYIKYWGAEQTGRHSAGDKTNFLNLGRTRPLDADDLYMGCPVVTPKGMGLVAKVSKDGKRVLTSLGAEKIKDCHKMGLRDSLWAPPGHVIVVGDSSNIEARKVCYLAGQEDILNVYRSGGDPYILMASELFQKEMTKETHPVERQLGKVMVLSLGFGAGEEKFLVIVRGWDYGPAREQVQKYLDDERLLRGAVRVFRNKYWCVKDLWDYQRDVVIPALAEKKRVYADSKNLTYTTDEGTILLPNDRCLRYPNIRLTTNKTAVPGTRAWGKEWVFDVMQGRRQIPTKIYGGKMVENETQAMARVIVMDQVVQISRKYRVVLSVYDEAVCCVPEEQAEECEAYVKQCLSTPPKWAPDFPVAAETGVGNFYGACK